MKMIHLDIPGSRQATLEGFLLDVEKLTLGQEHRRPAVIVCPGGGYIYCSNAEGEPIALAYSAKGFHSFVLRYSCGHDAAGFAPLKELSWAIGHIRENAQDWNVDPDKIIVCGFSAGGHLALSSGLMAENRPNAMILGYPAASAPKMPGADFMLKFLTGKEDPTEEDAVQFDLVPKITAEAPPVFLASTAEDFLTPFGALPIAQKYASLGRPYELHVFGYGQHGLALANEVTANGSSRYLDPAFAHWLDLSVIWFHKTFGKLEFVDKSNSRMAAYLRDLGLDLPGF